MLKSWLSRCCLIFFSCYYLGLTFAYSEPTKSDPLQIYRDEIKQSEANASQTVLDALKAADPDSSSQQQNQPAPEASASSATPTSRSNNDKAFSPANKPTNPANSTNKNPWLQPNPWAKQPPNIWEKNAKVNPYSNAPIPGPTPSANLAIPSPPNIFAPSHSTPNTNKPRPNANF
ncbi:MAG: hypothetical protein RJA83_1391 [Pseudomonadota bacterium]|jgi:hypothetical protein